MQKILLVLALSSLFTATSPPATAEAPVLLRAPGAMLEQETEIYHSA